MPTDARPQGFLARLNTAQRVILFISGLTAVVASVFPSWTCNHVLTGKVLDTGRHFILDSNFQVPGVCYAPMAAVNVPNLLGELLVPLAIGALGYFIFKKPTAAPPPPAPPAS